MNGARKLLIFGGLGLVIWGMAYGLWYAVFAEHQALDGIGASLASGFAAAANRDASAVEAAMARYQETKYVYDRHVDIHSHWIGLAMLLILVGMASDRLHFPERVKYFLALALVLGAAIFPLGVFLQTVSHGPGPKAVAILGSGLVIASLAGCVAGFLRGPAAS